jgi:hypothetical protein
MRAIDSYTRQGVDRKDEIKEGVEVVKIVIRRRFVRRGNSICIKE